MSNTTRRDVLWRVTTAGVGATAVGLAGCSSSSEEGSTEPSANSGGATEEGSTGDGPVETETVGMRDDLAFTPAAVRVTAGTTVTFENTSSIGHTVTASGDGIPEAATYFASGEFDTEQAAVDAYPAGGNLEAGETYEHTFETTGTHDYYCIPHEMNGMVGTIEGV